MTVCSKCNKELDDKAKVCDDCGTPVPKKKFPVVPVIIGIAVLVAATLAAVLFIMNSGKDVSESGEKAIYIKDNKLFVADLSNNKIIEVGSKFESGTDEIEDLSHAYDMSNLVRLSRDKKLIFYPDNIKEKYYEGQYPDNIKESSYDLYYKDISKANQKPVLIDSGVSKSFPYTVSDDNIVTYVKKSGNTLYQYDINKKEKTEIDSKLDNFANFHIEYDGKSMLYIKKNGDMYFKEQGKEKEKISSDVSGIAMVGYIGGSKEQEHSMIYLKGDKAYKKEGDKKEAELTEGIENIVEVSGEDKFYYTKNISNDENTLMSYVEDDMKEQDEAMEMPEITLTYPYKSDYSFDEEYQAALDAYNTAYDEFTKAKSGYEEKEKRDALRRELNNTPLNEDVKELYYFDNKEVKKLSDKFMHIESRNSEFENPIIVFIEKSDKKVKLSEISDVYDVYDKLGSGMFERGKRVIAVGGEIFGIEKENAVEFSVSSKGDRIYFISDIEDGEKYGNLYEIKVEDNNISTPTLYDEGVYTESVFMYRDRMIYFKDCAGSTDSLDTDPKYSADYTGKLYIDKKQIDEDVYTLGMGYNMQNRDSSDIYYFKNYDTDKQYGDLRVYHEGASESIAENVSNFRTLDDGSILYLCNYKRKNNKGELRLYKDGESKDIDKDVMIMIDALNYR